MADPVDNYVSTESSTQITILDMALEESGITGTAFDMGCLDRIDPVVPSSAVGLEATAAAAAAEEAMEVVESVETATGVNPEEEVGGGDQASSETACGTATVGNEGGVNVASATANSSSSAQQKRKTRLQKEAEVV